MISATSLGFFLRCLESKKATLHITSPKLDLAGSITNDVSGRPRSSIIFLMFKLISSSKILKVNDYTPVSLGANLSSASINPSPDFAETLKLACDLTKSEEFPRAILVFAVLNKGISVALSPIAITSS